MYAILHNQLADVRIGIDDVVGNGSTRPGIGTAIDEEHLARCGLHALQELVDELAIVVGDAKRLWIKFIGIELLPLLWCQQILKPSIVPTEIAQIDTGLRHIGVEAFCRCGGTATEEAEAGLHVQLVLGECLAGGNFLLGLVLVLGAFVGHEELVEFFCRTCLGGYPAPPQVDLYISLLVEQVSEDICGKHGFYLGLRHALYRFGLFCRIPCCQLVQ